MLEKITWKLKKNDVKNSQKILQFDKKYYLKCTKNCKFSKSKIKSVRSKLKVRKNKLNLKNAENKIENMTKIKLKFARNSFVRK